MHRTFTVIAAEIITNWLIVHVLIAGGLATTSMSQRCCVSVHESNSAESVMPGRLVAGLWTLNPDTGVRIAPRQPV